MSGFIEGILAFPTVIFTTLLGVAMVYWLFVIIVGVDVDFLGGADGAVDGALDGAMDGALDGAVDGALDGAMDAGIDGAMDAAHGAIDAAHGAVDGAADGAADAAAHSADSAGGFLELLSALGLRKAPVTVVFTMLALWAWIVSFATMYYGGEWLSALITATFTGVVVFVLAIVVAVPITSVVIRPIGPLFDSEAAPGREMLLGRSCTITTGKVDGSFGQAEHKSDGESFLMNVICDKPNTLKKGDQALIISVDRARNIYVIEPMEPALLGDGSEGEGV